MKHILLLCFAILAATSAFGQREYCYNCAQTPSDYNTSPYGANSTRTDVVIYPNPVSDYFGITDNDNVKQIVLVNLLGRRVRTFEYNKGERYLISDLPQGVYLVQFVGKGNRVLTTQRMSKK